MFLKTQTFSVSMFFLTRVSFFLQDVYLIKWKENHRGLGSINIIIKQMLQVCMNGIEFKTEQRKNIEHRKTKK